MKFVRAVWLAVLLVGMLPLSAQLPAYYEPFRLYEDALELFGKEKYAAAAAKFDQFLDEKGYERLNNANEINANARFYQAVSSFMLQREDAAPLLKGYVAGFPENTKWSQAQYYLGRLYFENRLYSDALKHLRIAYDRGLATDEQYYHTAFMLGYSSFMENDNAAAMQYFDRAALTDDQYGFTEDVNYYKAILLYQNGDYGRAYDALKKLENSKKYGQETKLYLATAMLKLNRTEELFELADELERGRGRNQDAQVFFIVANAAYEQGDYAKSAQYFKTYIDKRGELSRGGYFRFAQSYYKTKRYDAAIPVYQRAISRERDTLTQIASYYLGFCYLEKNEKDNARAAFEIAAKTPEPTNPNVKQDALWQYAKVCFDTKYYEESLTALRVLESRYPNSPYSNEARSLIGELLLVSKNYPDAIKYYESAGVNTPRMQKAYQQACYYYGVRLVGEGKFAQADPFLQKAGQSTYDSELSNSARYWLGESKFRQEQYEAAVEAYKGFQRNVGASSHPDKDMATYGLAWTYFKQKKYSSSLTQFDSFIKNADRNMEPRYVVDAHLRAGDCQFLKKNYALADPYYKRVLDFNYAGRDYASYQLAESQYRQGKYPESVAQFNQMVNRYKRSELRDNALDRMSEIYATWIKDYGKAKTFATQLVREYPRSPLAAAAYNRIALASYFSGDERGAINNFKKVLEDYPGDEAQCQIALENLSQLLSASEYDRVFKAYKASNPKVNENLADLTFNTGADRFYAGNYQGAVDQLSSYINDYPNGTNYFEALILRARSYKALGQLDNALSDYNTVYSATPKNAYTNVALLEAADTKYEQQKFDTALDLFKLLEQTAEKQENQIEAKFGMAKCYMALGDYVKVSETLNSVASDQVLPEATRQRAQLEIGIAKVEQGQYPQAAQILQQVVDNSDTEYGARAQYNIARALLGQNRYQDTKDAVLVVSNKYPTYNYWKAKAFLVSAEADIRLGNKFQARATLESLINNAEFPDITSQAEQMLAGL
jgi:TolA-binding protein